MIESQFLGLDNFSEYLRQYGPKATEAAQYAVNDAADFARRLGVVEIRKQVNLKARYLTGGGNQKARLAVTRRARSSDLEAIVTGRDRPTSLARYSPSAKTVGRRRTPIRVKVSASGAGGTFKNAFFMRLPRGSAAVTEENSNLGLAVRLKPGERVRNKREMVPFGGGLYLLYGPSVGQVYRSVSVDTLDRVNDQLQDRFAHQINRLVRG